MQFRLLPLVVVGVSLLGSSAPEIWNSKAAAQWTQEDAQQILKRSPWAKERPTPISGRPNVSYVDGDPAVNGTAVPSAELGGNGAVRNGVAPVARNPSLRSGPVEAPQQQPTLRIVWASALPIRLAVLKVRAAGTEVSAEQVAKAVKESTHYVVAVVGLGAPEAGSDPKALASAAFLSVRGKPQVGAVDSDYRRIGNDDVYFFRFARTALPLAASDGEVGFRFTMGAMKLDQKFKLADMNYQGRLSL